MPLLCSQSEKLLRKVVVACEEAVAGYEPMPADLARDMERLLRLVRALLHAGTHPAESGEGSEAPASLGGAPTTAPRGGRAAASASAAASSYPTPKPGGGCGLVARWRPQGGEMVVVNGGGPEAQVLDYEDARGGGGGGASPAPAPARRLDLSHRELNAEKLKALLKPKDLSGLEVLNLEGKSARDEETQDPQTLW